MTEATKHATPGNEPLYAVSAEFDTPDALLEAARSMRGNPYGRIQIYSPLPIAGAIEAVGREPKPIPHWMGTGAAVLGFLLMMGMCIYATAVSYVFDIGGRPFISWPAFMVPSVSFAMLLGAAVVFVNMMFLCRLPLLNHPSFNIPGFLRATQDRYFLTVEMHEPDNNEHHADALERDLKRLSPRPLAVHKVPR